MNTEKSDMTRISGLIFDYGGTLDTDSVHWSWVLWDAYVAEGVDVTLPQFREAYVHGERTLAKEPLIKPEHNMLDLLRIKVDVETRYLMEQEWLQVQEVTRRAQTEHIALRCYNHVKQVLERSRQVLDALQPLYPMVLVSNFYGNIHIILRDFRLDHYFTTVIESAVVGIRKPDPRIFQLGVDALHMPASRVAVVGDSYSKDIVPASSLGCKTVWIRGRGWSDESDNIDPDTPSAILQSITQLTPHLLESL